jgi:hypothetical protein
VSVSAIGRVRSRAVAVIRHDRATTAVDRVRDRVPPTARRPARLTARCDRRSPCRVSVSRGSTAGPTDPGAARASARPRLTPPPRAIARRPYCRTWMPRSCSSRTTRRSAR